uniref:Uncharacterized protein LOC104219850 n=1 Tax=Nicotiana sylvestris TaxID=4096 RepID=A0A1U7VLP7_NICSY|nr:PREDICTED: uncharacterized protein LOC104219850 [Nicotiana sylvestris]
MLYRNNHVETFFSSPLPLLHISFISTPHKSKFLKNFFVVDIFGIGFGVINNNIKHSEIHGHGKTKLCVHLEFQIRIWPGGHCVKKVVLYARRLEACLFMHMPVRKHIEYDCLVKEEQLQRLYSCGELTGTVSKGLFDSDCWNLCPT